MTTEWNAQRVDEPVKSAFDWAIRLRQKTAYDGLYVAAADQLSAELWTADQNLANNAYHRRARPTY